MSKRQVFHYVRGQLFYNDYPKWNGRRKAEQYCEENGIDKKEIYSLFNDSELKCLKTLLEMREAGLIKNINTHQGITLINRFTNKYGHEIPPYTFVASFTYQSVETNEKHTILIPSNVYEITREVILTKTLFDYLNVDCQALEIYLYDEETNSFNEWKIGDKEEIKKIKKQEHKQLLAQKRIIRDRQKFDRLLKLRDEGKITEKQTKEMYRLEKLFRG